MLLIEEKEIPVQIDLVPMRSYGDKPREFMQKVPSGLLPAIQVNGGQVITESQVIMELLDRWHTPEDGYKPMMPAETDQAGRAQYATLARLERAYVMAATHMFAMSFQRCSHSLFATANAGCLAGGAP
jgi:glutathione S-transferase